MPLEPYGDGQRWVIVNHFDPHPDEYGADFVTYYHGEAKHPGISRAKLLVVDIHDPRNFMLTFEQYLARKVLLIGVGGGPLDEHAIRGERKKNESSISLTANYFGLTPEEYPELQLMIKAIRKSDLEGDKSQLSFGKQLTRKSKWLRHLIVKGRISKQDAANEWEKMALWAITTLYNDYYRYDREMWSREVEDDVRACSDIYRTEPPRGRRYYRFAVVKTEDPMVVDRVHAEYHPALTIVKNPRTRQVSILRGDDTINLDPIARALRVEEQRLAGFSYGVSLEVLAKAEDILRDCWHYWRGKPRRNGNNASSTDETEGLGFFNGNHRGEMMQATRIPLKRIMQIVEEELNAQAPLRNNS